MFKNKKKFLSRIFLILFLTGSCFLFYEFGVYTGERNILKTSPDQIINSELGIPENVDFSVFWETWRQAERNFLDRAEMDSQKMIYGAITGMIDSLGDPYTNFFEPKEAEKFEQELSGKYQGVGMVVGIKDEQLIVISPFKESPAERAGLKPGDNILKIEDIRTIDISIEKAVELIKGPEGTKVKLLIERKEWENPKEIEIQREVIKIPTLEWEIKNENIALIKIYQFNGILNSEFRKIVPEILNSKCNKIILDLRNNPGGYLETAQDIAGWFLEKGTVVLLEDEGENKEQKVYKSKGPATFSSFPVVILINNGSASASEILAGALRDQKGVQLVGETSFGKGSVQKPITLSDGSFLKVTIARWLTPNGHRIDEIGLEPDVIVEMLEHENETEKDLQLEKAIEILENMG
ncbi:S41 family peptidase [Candidatus Atribacteria bacterium MT.SAG.1]|nr:S41 family peptidase [Candidatus Atribacteria bacterium MT.SAG.1]